LLDELAQVPVEVQEEVDRVPDEVHAGFSISARFPFPAKAGR
jgi:hypothetical protein